MYEIWISDHDRKNQATFSFFRDLKQSTHFLLLRYFHVIHPLFISLPSLAHHLNTRNRFEHFAFKCIRLVSLHALAHELTTRNRVNFLPYCKGEGWLISASFCVRNRKNPHMFFAFLIGGNRDANSHSFADDFNYPLYSCDSASFNSWVKCLW